MICPVHTLHHNFNRISVKEMASALDQPTAFMQSEDGTFDDDLMDMDYLDLEDYMTKFLKGMVTDTHGHYIAQDLQSPAEQPERSLTEPKDHASTNFEQDENMISQLNAPRPVDGYESSPQGSHLPDSIIGLITNTSSQRHYTTMECRSTYHSPLSNFNSPATFMTASTPGLFVSAQSTYSPAIQKPFQIDTIAEEPVTEASVTDPIAKLRVDYPKDLHRRKLILPVERELNWSGKGQHIAIDITEKLPLTPVAHLGSSCSAIVDKVLCGRIPLARKRMRCTRLLTVQDALAEVEHLQRLQHFHIVQLVGTYLQGRNFGILMYPAADCHLGTFLEDTADLMSLQSEKCQDPVELRSRRNFLSSSLRCLTSAVAFIHENTTKHMDIKPANIVVRCTGGDPAIDRSSLPWRIYITDFGLSRTFVGDQSQTDGRTGRTPKYYAPEVFALESRGRAADMFSLGCVFLEMLTVYCGHHLHELSAYFTNNQENLDASYCLHLALIGVWIQQKLHILPFDLTLQLTRILS